MVATCNPNIWEREAGGEGALTLHETYLKE